MTEQRAQSRITDAELVMIFWDDNGTRRYQLGNVENLSGDGAGIIVDHELPAGTAITMTYGEGELNAIVRHCAPAVEEHFIGVEFVGESRASVLHFDPILFTSK